MDKRTVIYYTDELNDEFSTAVITPRRIDGNYRYVHDSLWKCFTHFFWYRVVATPIAYTYTKCAFRHEIVGRELLRQAGNTGYFLYGNHTQPTGDAAIPSMLTFPRDAYVVVHPNNVSMPYLGRITPSLGALPLPDDMPAYRNFIKAIETRIEQKKAVVVYPEAHIWPYYTHIRPFRDDSFAYPVKLGAPVYCFTNTYQPRKYSKKPRIVTYIDGPFYPDSSLPLRAQRKELRDRVYTKMCERAVLSTVEQIKYIKRKVENG